LPPAAKGLPPDPRVITPTYYYNFVEFISNAKCVLLPSTKKKIAGEMFCLCFSCTFAPIFHFVVFVDWEAQEYFLLLGTGYRVTQSVISGVAIVPCAQGQKIFLRPHQQKLQSLK